MLESQKVEAIKNLKSKNLGIFFVIIYFLISSRKQK